MLSESKNSGNNVTIDTCERDGDDMRLCFAFGEGRLIILQQRGSDTLS